MYSSNYHLTNKCALGQNSIKIVISSVKLSIRMDKFVIKGEK